jgi:streptogramin lyase
MRSRHRAVCAAFALACVLTCASSAWGVYVADLREPGDFSGGCRQRVSYNDELGGLMLDKALVTVPFLWIPSPRENTVSKLDARTGHEIARYRMGPQDEDWFPRAVATDSDGNAYIACLCQAGRGKIVRIAALQGSDLNGDGIVSTSGDGDANGRITDTEVLPWGTDERVSLVAEVGSDGSAPTCLVFDDSGYLWVTLWGERSIAKVDPVRRCVVAMVPLVGRPDFAVADQRRNIWILSRDSRVLCRVSTVLNTLCDFFSLGDCIPGGMCIDDAGKLWIGDRMDGLIGYQTVSGVWSRHRTDDAMGLSGVTVDSDGDIWASCPDGNQIARFLKEDGSFAGYVPTGARPGPICMDDDGYLWSLDEGSETATRIDVRDGRRILSTQLSGSPYSSSPFTSCVVRRGVCPDGTWRSVFDSRIKGAGWGTISWQAILNTGNVKVEARTAETPEELAAKPFVAATNGMPLSVPDGRHIEVRVTLTGNNSASPVLQSLRVEGRNRAPDVSAAAPTITRINRPDRTMEPVSIVGIVDPEGDPFEVTITGVTQDEPVSGLCEEDQAPDATGVGTASVKLRAELAPGLPDAPANGRVYTIAFKAVDALGACSTGKVKVVVPVGTLPTDTAKDDGQRYDSTRTVAGELLATAQK